MSCTFVCVDKECGDQTQVINIPMSSSQDFPLAVLGCYKDFCSIANVHSLCHSEGFLDVSFKYLGGLWLLFEFNSLEARNSFLKHDEIEGVPIRAWEYDVFKSICNKWGEVIFNDDSNLCNRLSKRLCIKSKHNQLVFATIFVTLMNVTYAIQVRELCSWTPMFVEIDSDKKDKEMQSNDDLWILRQVWGNTHFDFASMSSRGLSGGIICLWNKFVFRKTSISCNENYVAIEGLWILNNVRIMWIVVYAPQALQDKIALWSSISNLTHNWDGILIAVGDFNMVREAGERFDERHADIFNAFISNSSLIDGIPDHRPILIKEHLGVIRDWIATKKHESTKLKQEHVLRLATIDAKIDNGIANDLNFENRKESIKVLGRNIGVSLPLKLSSDQRAFLDRDISREEIKKAVWDCGGDRAPGPDGFTFKIFTILWDLLESDVTRFVHAFFLDSSFPKGCNSSFIALIPKVSNATLVTDFRPISLIGCQYKIIGKILANRLGLVISSCISPKQSAFIKGRNILDGLLILNEVMNWYRKRKEKLMIFKVDFEKAFDSLRWDFLDTIMEKLGFGSRWRVWIKGCFVNACSSILGASVRNEHLCVSYLIYADDVIFVGSGPLQTDLGERKMASVSWKTCLASKEMGGLGIGSIHALNVGILFKLIWRFLYNHSDLWIHVIKGIYGRTCGISGSRVHGSSQIPWRGILSMVKSIKLKGVDLFSLCHCKLGNGETISFWDDFWCGDQSLKSKFPRIYSLDNDKGCNVASRLSLPDWGSVLRRNPRGGIEASQLKDLRLLIKPVVLNSHQGLGRLVFLKATLLPLFVR
nr:RNA-directed DNA polymerase, eukaryota, reverse transcriptase zinc-binding domain protein [Tanacetum cinerariifolium]